MGEYSTYGGSISITENAVGNCPEVKVKLGGVDVGCLIDIQHPHRGVDYY